MFDNAVFFVLFFLLLLLFGKITFKSYNYTLYTAQLLNSCDQIHAAEFLIKSES